MAHTHIYAFINVLEKTRVKLVIRVFKLILIVAFWPLQYTYTGMSHSALCEGSNLVPLYGACPCCMSGRPYLNDISNRPISKKLLILFC